MAWSRCMKHSLKATEMDCAGHVLPLGHVITSYSIHYTKLYDIVHRQVLLER